MTQKNYVSEGIKQTVTSVILTVKLPEFQSKENLPEYHRFLSKYIENFPVENATFVHFDKLINAVLRQLTTETLESIKDKFDTTINEEMLQELQQASKNYLEQKLNEVK